MKSKLFPMFRVSAIALASALSVTTACASPISWDGSDSTAWALETNWAGDAFPADDLTSDTAVFNLASYTTPVFAPNAGTRSIGGIKIGDDTTSTGSLTLAGTMLSVGGSGIDMRENAGVTTISSPVTLGAAQTWQNASSNLLTVSSAVTGGNLLTVGGAGNTTISGVISGTGALVKEGAGTLTLGSTANTYSGGTTVNNGTLNISSAGASGIGCINGTLTINSATTVNATNWALGYDSTAGRYVHTINIIGGTLNKINSGSGTSAQTINMTGGAITGAVVDLYNLATANSDIAFNTNASATTATVSAGLNLRMENGGGTGGSLTFTVADGEAATDLLISGNITFGGTASTQRITKADAGTLVLSGANTYGGATTISGGTLEIGGSGKLGNGSYAGAITNNASLVYSSTSAQTLSGVISGTGTLTKSGNSTLTLTNIDTYSGNTTINEGTLVLSGSGKLANSPVIDVATGATLQGGVFGTGQTVRGTGTLAGTVTLGAGAALSPAGDAAIGTMPVTGTVSLGGTVSMQIQKTGGVVSGDQFTGAGAITYGGALVVTATGETLDVGDSIQLFANSGGRSNTFTSITLPTLPDGLSWNSSNLSATGTLTVANSLSIPVFSPAGGAFAGAQSVTISSDPGTTLYYTMDGNEPTGSSPNADSPVTNLAVPVGTTTTIKAFARKTGFSDTPVVTSTYTIYSSAQWNVDNSGNWSDAGNWLNNAIPSGPGALVDFFSFAQSASTTVTLDSDRTVGAITFGNINPIDWTVDASNGAVLTLADASIPVITVNGTDMAATISAPLAGGQGLTKSGAGKLTLSGTNTYTGATTLNGGTLSIGAATHLPSGSALTLSGGSTLNVTGTMTLANSVTIASGQSGVIRASGTGYATLTGNYSNVAGTLDLDLGTAGRIDINSANGPGVGSTVRVFDATASGTSYMAMNNTNAQNFYTEAKVIFNDSGAATTTIYLGNHAGKNVKFGALDGGSATTRMTSDNSANTVTITGTADGNFAGVISNVNSGTITLVKTGSATQTLSGVNTYTGTTTVNAGTLVAANTSGSATGTGAVTVKPAATLAGTGSIGGATTIESGGFVAPGSSSIDTLTVASATMSGTYQCDLGASTSDLIAVTGTLTVDGTTSITFSGTPTANSYTIASYGTLSGTLPAITPPSGYSLVDDSANKQIKLVKVTGYDSWMEAWVTAGFTGDPAVAADPDADGMKNLLEFVLNGNPGASDTTILPVQQVTATDLVFSFTRRVDSATATTQVFEYGSNLAGWTPLNITGTPGEGVVIGTPTGTAPDQVQTVTITIPRSAEGNGRLFGRLVVTQP